MRPRLSKAFVDRHRRDRLVTGLSTCIVEKGYRQTTVADVMSATHVARNTFYDCFGSKEDAGRGLLRSACPGLDADELDGSIFVLALEVAARLKLDDQIGASALIADSEQLLDKSVKVEPFEPQGTEDDPTLAQLPPGRHGLPCDFVKENQRRRLLAGTARAVYERGYEAATIKDIVATAAVSRRTFYEHFDGKRSAIAAMLTRAQRDDARTFLFDSALGHLWAEVVAAPFCGDEVSSESRRRQAQAVIGILGAQLDAAVAA